MRTVLILLLVAMSVAAANVERKSNFTKPIINLERRPRPPVWNRPPEERRKLSIFPKTNMKFVVTPKTVQNDNAAKEGLSTKRPLMRKFVMQDKNDKGTWSFAPREPLMKSKRFTVTVAPTQFNKRIDEPKPDESKKINSVIKNQSNIRESRKVNNVKGNLIDMIYNKKNTNTGSKKQEKVEQKLVGEVSSRLFKVNDTKVFDIIPMKDSVTDETKLTESKSIEMPVTESKTGLKSVESKTVDLSEVKYPIDRNVNNSLIMINAESNNHKIGEVLAFNDLEILLDKIVNHTEESHVNLASGHNLNESTKVSNSETNASLEDIRQFDVAKSNAFFEVVSLEEQNKEVKEESSAAETTVQDSLNTDDHYIAHSSNTNVLNEEKDLSVITSNLENLLNIMEINKDKQTFSHEKSFDDYKKEFGREMSSELLEKFDVNAPDGGEIASNHTVDETKDKLQTGLPGNLNNNNLTILNSEEILLEVYESNRDLSMEESSIESLADEQSKKVFHGSMTGTLLTLEERSNEARETSDESISDTLNNHTEELSDEPLIDVSNNLTRDTISNESSSNMAVEELSNEYDIDKSNNLTDEVSNDSIIETSNNFTDKEIPDSLSVNISGEDLSNESNADKSISLTEEISKEFIIESSNNFTGEEVSNESSSNMAAEELSNESFVDKSNLTEEISNESTVGSSNHLAGEDISDEWLVDQSDGVVDEFVADESLVSSPDTSVDEISDEALRKRFKRSNNIIEEENLATTITWLKYTGRVKNLDHDLSYKNINA